MYEGALVPGVCTTGGLVGSITSGGFVDEGALVPGVCTIVGLVRSITSGVTSLEGVTARSRTNGIYST